MAQRPELDTVECIAAHYARILGGDRDHRTQAIAELAVNKALRDVPEVDTLAELLALSPDNAEAWAEATHTCPVPGLHKAVWTRALQGGQSEAGDSHEETPRTRSAAQLRLDAARVIADYLLEPDPIRPDEASRLSLRQWEVVALTCNRRLEASQVAELLRVEVSTVRKHLSDAARVLGLSVKELRRRRLALR